MADLERDLVARAASGDAEAVDEVLARVRPGMVRFCRGRLGTYPAGAELAQDTVQEILLAVRTALPRYADQGAPFESFCYRIARNKVADVQRQLSRQPWRVVDELPDRAGGRTPEELYLVRETLGEVLAVVATLPRRQAQILLEASEGLSSAEIGEIHDLSVGAVRVELHRARKRLREGLEP